MSFSTYQQRRKNKLCGTCGLVETGKKSICDGCKARQEARGRTTYMRGYRKSRRDKAVAEGKCPECAKNPLAPGRKICQSCLKRRVGYVDKKREEGKCSCGRPLEPGQTRCKLHIQAARQRYHSLKREVIDHYGSICTCCGETMREALEIDHINNDGAAHRLMVPGPSLYCWLRKNNWPSGYQVLCSTCNRAKGNKRACCPHKAVVDGLLKGIVPDRLIF